MKTKFTLFFSIISVASALLFTGCNTIGGAGEDVERAGEEIQEAAD